MGCDFGMPLAIRYPRPRSVARALVAVATCLPFSFAVGAPRVFAVANTPMSLPVFIAQADGLFDAQGLTVKVEQCAFGKVCLDQLLEGHADFCTAADLPIVMATLKPRALAIVATIGTDANDAKIVTRRSGPVQSASDLSGKTIGVSFGTSGQYFLDSVALLAGVDPSSFRLVDLSSDDMLVALQERRVDAVSAFEPTAHNLAKGLGRDANVLSARHLYTLTWNLVASPATVSGGEDDSKRLLRALDIAIDRIARDPQRAKAVLRDRLHLDDEAIAWIWPDLSFGLELRQSLIKTLEGEARWALRSHSTATLVPNYLTFVHDGPLKAVKPAAVEIVR